MGRNYLLLSWEEKVLRSGSFIINNVEYVVHKSKPDKEGRYQILDVTLVNKRINLVNIYGLNRDHPQFYIQYVSWRKRKMIKLL